MAINQKNTSPMQDLNMTKEQMVRTIIILLDVDDGMYSQLSKLSIPALNAIFTGLNNNAIQYSLAKQQERNARELLKVEEARNRSLSRDLRKAKAK